MDGHRPKVGIGVMILKDGKVLLGRRLNAHGAGVFAFPGGHLEHGESFENCARREVMEECGLEISQPRFLFVANLMDYWPKHYTHLGFIAEWISGEPENREPDKCEGWNWYDLDKLPSPRFSSCDLSFESYGEDKIYFDAPSRVTEATPTLKVAGQKK